MSYFYATDLLHYGHNAESSCQSFHRLVPSAKQQPIKLETIATGTSVDTYSLVAIEN